MNQQNLNKLYEDHIKFITERFDYLTDILARERVKQVLEMYKSAKKAGAKIKRSRVDELLGEY